MEPFTAGAIALATLLLNKTFEKTGEIIVAKAFEQAGKVINLLKGKSPETAKMIEAAENPALPAGETEYIDVDFVETVESEAKKDPEIQAALADLAAILEEAKTVNPQLAEEFQKLAETVKAQRESRQNITNIAKENKGNVAVGGDIHIKADNFTQNFN